MAVHGFLLYSFGVQCTPSQFSSHLFLPALLESRTVEACCGSTLRRALKLVQVDHILCPLPLPIEAAIRFARERTYPNSLRQIC
jgi:hypothetical protein